MPTTPPSSNSSGSATPRRSANAQILHKPRRARRRSPSPETLRARVADLANRGRAIANQLVALYNSAHSGRDREFILETATELRLLLMQPGAG